MATNVIKDEHLKLIKGVVGLHRPAARVYYFGSRATGAAKPVSDFDLLIRENKEIPMDALADIREMLKASRLPFSVDVVDWQALSEDFRRAIEADLKEF